MRRTSRAPLLRGGGQWRKGEETHAAFTPPGGSTTRHEFDARPWKKSFFASRKIVNFNSTLMGLSHSLTKTSSLPTLHPTAVAHRRNPDDVPLRLLLLQQTRADIDRTGFRREGRRRRSCGGSCLRSRALRASLRGKKERKREEGKGGRVSKNKLKKLFHPGSEIIIPQVEEGGAK